MVIRTKISLRTNAEMELEKYDNIFKEIEGLELITQHEITEKDGLKRFIYNYESE